MPKKKPAKKPPVLVMVVSHPIGHGYAIKVVGSYSDYVEGLGADFAETTSDKDDVMYFNTKGAAENAIDNCSGITRSKHQEEDA